MLIDPNIIMPKCKDCKLIENMNGKKGQCYGFRIPDVRLNIECKFFKDK